MKKYLVGLAAVVGLLAAGVGAPAQAAVRPVTFTYVHVDSPGKDDRSNASINKEYFRITNNLTKPLNLNRWSARDAAGKVYVFGNLTLGAKKSLIIRSGKGTTGKPAGTLYWNSGNYVWNNTGDTATLRSPSGATMDTCSFKKVVSTKC